MIGNRIREIRLVEPVSWWFRFTSGAIRADSLWRVIKGGGIQATSTDHGHLFG